MYLLRFNSKNKGNIILIKIEKNFAIGIITTNEEGEPLGSITSNAINPLLSLESISVNLLRVTRQSVQDPSGFLSFPFVLAGHASFCMRARYTYIHDARRFALKWGR